MDKITFLTADTDEMTEKAQLVVEGILGRTISRADPLMLFLKSILSIIAQQRLLIDELANQNLLYYATGQPLEAIGELVGVTRRQAAAATCTVEVKLSTAREKTTIINAGTRINADNKINFALDEAVIFLSGEVTKYAKATCQEAGEVGNGYKEGEICRIVDPQPFLLSIRNVTQSAGGAEVETDEGLRERIRNAPERFSVAGPAGAYEFHAKQVSSQVSDVYVASEEPGEVTVYVLLENGEIPGAEMLNKIYEHLNAANVKPLTDLVHVKPSVEIEYQIDVDYWIAKSDQTRANAIIAAAELAIEGYESWQRAKLGRDLNPTELYYRLRAAGVKRAEIKSPAFMATPPNAVAVPIAVNVRFKGLEDD